MCGIAGGIWNDPQLALDAEVMRRMTDALAHRGPDDEGQFKSEYRVRPPYEPLPGVAIGARRLSIIDLEGGHQPISNEDGTVWVALNGEIYNFRELRQRLEGSGHKFRTNCDTEVLVHLYEDAGQDFAQHLVGMFAVSIWDESRRKLVLARDRLGQKPLVYRQETNRLLFASEIKSLLQVPDVPREVDPSSLDEYLTYQYVPHPNTIFKGIRKLPPGHVGVYCDGDFTVEPYWDPDWRYEADLPEGILIERLRDELTRAVELRLQSDVPLGAFLSGGLDSSLIVALMQQLSGERVKTFSIGFPVPEYDETAHARRVAAHLQTDHREFRVEPNAVEVLPKLAWHFDEPFGDSSALPTWYVAELTRQHVTVALTGDGGDELFAGYPRYRALRLGAAFDGMPGFVRAAAGAGVWQKLPGARRRSFLRRIKRFAKPLRMPPGRRYLEWIAIFDEANRAALYRDEFLERLPNADPCYFLDTAWRRAGSRDAIAAAAVADLQTYLPCDLMTKVDISSMAHSLECRQPFLDHRVVELANAIPTRMKYRRGRGKRILRAAFNDLLPDDIFRRKKMGFGVPLDYWFRHELKDMAHDVLLSQRAADRGYFRSEAVRDLLEEHCLKNRDHADQLWALLMLELWHREWID
jgi:asparagine synthase (glutamine-hydrolysing)